MHEYVFTLDERARLSEDEALRRRFDHRNIRILRWACWPLAALSLGLFIAAAVARGDATRAAIAFLALTAAVGTGLLLRRVVAGKESHRWLAPLALLAEERGRAFTLAFLATTYLLLWGYAFGLRPGPYLLGTLFAWFAVAFRLLPSETALLYIGNAGFVATEAMVTGGFTAKGDESVLAVLPNVAFAMVLSLWLTRRARMMFQEEWRAAKVDAVEQLRIRDELGFARELQLSMLPREAPPVPWIEAAAMSLPATEVGGDYYDYLVIDEGRLVAVTGDVAGHGIASGIVLSGVRSGLALLAGELSDPGAVMRRLHRMVRQTLRHRMLVSLSILLFDRANHTATLTAAAHPPLFVRRASGSVERIDTSSLPLGNGLGDRFDQRVIGFEPGDAFVLQTDGVYETTSPSGESYGFLRMERVLASVDGSASAIRDAILRDLWAFKGTAPQGDDVTVVVLRVK
ncbi:MAG TPA: PP2C family protein-serine/threonine phosphatase [Thermoanaerobaculia bacterium]|nr:PP2C family protein-serine/threonine phosphatase [Thermoanaerobaculia bacterium]